MASLVFLSRVRGGAAAQQVRLTHRGVPAVLDRVVRTTREQLADPDPMVPKLPPW